MSRADELKARALRRQERRQKVTPAVSTEPGDAQVEVRTEPARARTVDPLTKPVRQSVDLTPAEYRQLAEWRAAAAEEIGRAKVNSRDVFRALLARLLSDEELSRQIRTDLRG
jgi:hypothetical protein